MEEKIPSGIELTEASQLDLYAGAFLQVSDCAYLMDKDCRLIACNRGMLGLLKIDSLVDQDVGAIYRLMQAASLITGEQAKILKQKDIECLLAGEMKIIEAEIPFYRPDREIIRFKAARYPLKNERGEVLGLLVLLSDQSELHYLRDQLAKLRKELQEQNQQANRGFKQPFEDHERQHPVRILLIEDNPIAQKAAKAVLMHYDCLVEIAQGEADLKQLFKPQGYDLVFMDLGLEGTTGYLMAKYIRQQEQAAAVKEPVPIIALTGFDADAVRFDCDYYQMQGAISKPLQPEQVQQIIQKFIRHIDVQVSGMKKG